MAKALHPAKQLRLDAVREQPDAAQEARWVGYITLGGHEFNEMSILSDEQMLVEMKAVEKYQREMSGGNSGVTIWRGVNDTGIFQDCKNSDSQEHHEDDEDDIPPTSGRRSIFVPQPDDDVWTLSQQATFNYSKTPRAMEGCKTLADLRDPKRAVIQRLEVETMASERQYAFRWPSPPRYVLNQKKAKTYRVTASDKPFTSASGHMTIPENLSTFVGDAPDHRTKGGFTKKGKKGRAQ